MNCGKKKKGDEEDENEWRKELRHEMMKRVERLAICISRLYCTNHGRWEKVDSRKLLGSSLVYNYPKCEFYLKKTIK